MYVCVCVYCVCVCMCVYCECVYVCVYGVRMCSQLELVVRGGEGSGDLGSYLHALYIIIIIALVTTKDCKTCYETFSFTISPLTMSDGFA